MRLITVALSLAPTRIITRLVPRRGDPPAAGWATRAAYEPLLAAGVRIFEYEPRKLHAKTSVIDAATVPLSARVSPDWR